MKASTLGTAALIALTTTAQAADPPYTVTFGPAAARFNVSSTELSGPAGTTPPGATLSVDNLSTAGLEVTRHLDNRWSVTLALGLPPKAQFTGQGSAAPLGGVGSARAWFPALLAGYSFELGPVRPYIAAGVNYTFYTDVNIGSNFTAAFGGTESNGKIKASFGPVAKLGLMVPLGDGWQVNAGWARYGIKNNAEVTTQTPGVGPITRSLTLRSDPDVWSVLIGRSF